MEDFDFDSELLPIDRHIRVYMPYSGLNYRSVVERVRDFNEVVIQYTPEEAMVEAARCIHCPHPEPCIEACPLHNDIPAALWLIEQGEFINAAEIFRRTTTFPEVCGRVCPQEHLCEGSCVHNARGEAIHIGACEFFCADYEREHAEVKIKTGVPTGFRVAVVGGGPSGLACAELLVSLGHEVTIFEAKPLPGGLLLYGIPGFKMSNRIVYMKLNELSNAGVKFVTNTTVGKDVTVDALFQQGFQAVYLAIGAGVDVPLNAPGEDLPGVFEATEFLLRANVDLDKLPKNLQPTRPEVGKRVVVVGGGDTASDCERTALRLGAEKVICMYRRTEREMPGSRKDRGLAQQEGTEWLYLTQPVRFIAGEDGKLASVECIRMELGQPDARGRRQPVPVEGSNFTVEADTAVLALGFSAYPIIGETTPGLKTHRGGLIVIDQKTGATSRPGVFAGGDGVTGPALVVTAGADGRRAAWGIHNYLNNLPRNQ
ncbi:MAG TPA: NAD(P)-dependent oxidoreductase [Anaerolineaceae bacterium]